MNKTERYDRYFMKKAELASEMSHCDRRKVGAILTKDNRTLLDGWNGTLSGLSNKCEEEVMTECGKCSGKGFVNLSYGSPIDIDFDSDAIREFFKDEAKTCDKCNGEGFLTELVTNEFTMHAEQNLLASAAKKGISTEGATLYLTLSPCKTCAKLIASAGIVRVVYKEAYKDTSGIEFLQKCGVIVDEVDGESFDESCDGDEPTEVSDEEIDKAVGGVLGRTAIRMAQEALTELEHNDIAEMMDRHSCLIVRFKSFDELFAQGLPEVTAKDLQELEMKITKGATWSGVLTEGLGWGVTTNTVFSDIQPKHIDEILEVCDDCVFV